MKLVQCLTKHLNSWAGVLPQERSLERTTALGVGLVCGVGKRTLTRAIGFHDNTQKDGSADYKMLSRSPWEPRDLFAPILREAIEHHELKRIIVSVDDTRLWRTGQPPSRRVTVTLPPYQRPLLREGSLRLTVQTATGRITLPLTVRPR